MTQQNLFRGTSGVSLPPALSTEIWAVLQQQSAVMNLANKIDLPGSGITLNDITGDAAANWVNESEEKPVSDSTITSKAMTPYKLAVIETFSNEFRRDLPALYDTLAQRLPGALALKFDQTVFHATAAPGSNFGLLSAAQFVTLDATDTYGDLTNADALIAQANGVTDGWVFSPKGRSVLLAAKDTLGRPLIVSDIQAGSALGSILGARVVNNRAAYKADAAGDNGEVIGFAGDWTAAAYGTVAGIQISVTEEATVNKGGTQINLWQRNMFALRAEIEVGFVVHDLNRFVKLVSGVNVIS